MGYTKPFRISRERASVAPSSALITISPKCGGEFPRRKKLQLAGARRSDTPPLEMLLRPLTKPILLGAFDRTRRMDQASLRNSFVLPVCIGLRAETSFAISLARRGGIGLSSE